MRYLVRVLGVFLLAGTSAALVFTFLKVIAGDMG